MVGTGQLVQLSHLCPVAAAWLPYEKGPSGAADKRYSDVGYHGCFVGKLYPFQCDQPTRFRSAAVALYLLFGHTGADPALSAAEQRRAEDAGGYDSCHKGDG